MAEVEDFRLFRFLSVEVFFLRNVSFYLFLAVLGLCCCTDFSASRGYSSYGAQASHLSGISCEIEALEQENFSSSGMWPQ